MPGQMIPDRNCARNDAWYSSWLSARNLAWKSRRRPNTLTSACPENDSSTRALRRPTLRHCTPNAFCDFGPMTPKITPMSGRDTSATSASFQEIENIITSTPSTVSTAVSAPDSDCCIVCVMLSMSFVTREMSSPRCTRSKYASGSRLIFSSTCSRSRHMARTMTMLMMKPWPQVSRAPATYSARTMSSSRPSRLKSTPAPGTKLSSPATRSASLPWPAARSPATASACDVTPCHTGRRETKPPKTTSVALPRILGAMTVSTTPAVPMIVTTTSAIL